MQNILQHPPIIETERLLIRPLTLADDEAIFTYASDPEVSKYVLFETHKSIEDTRTFINVALENYAKSEPCPLGIVLKDEQKLIGSVGYHNWNQKHQRTEIGYALSKHYWNKGFVTEAASGLIRALFNGSDLMRIEALCDHRHAASARVMEKIGMKCEGTLRKYIFSKGEFRDMKIYSIIRDDWQR